MRDWFRRESLVEQGFARFTEPLRPNEQPEVVLNEKGRVRFGFQHVEDRQTLMDEVDDDLVAFLRGESGLPDLGKYSEMLEEAQEGLEETGQYWKQSRQARQGRAKTTETWQSLNRINRPTCRRLDSSWCP